MRPGPWSGSGSLRRRCCGALGSLPCQASTREVAYQIHKALKALQAGHVPRPGVGSSAKAKLRSLAATQRRQLLQRAAQAAGGSREGRR